jgi:translation elongation factor EF-4
MILKLTIAGALGAALSFLGTFGFAQVAPPVHRGDWPIHHWHQYQPTQDELEKLDLQDVTRKEAKEVDRL